MSEMIQNLYNSLLVSTIATLKDELGLARGVNVAENTWKRFAEDIFPALKEKYQLNSAEIPDVAEFLKKIYTDIFGFKNVEVTGNADKSILVIKECHIWTLLKEKRLPPLCHKLKDKFVETIVRLANPSIVFGVGAHYRQGADRCEFELKKF
ncbi:MAG: hypothetical protein EAX96_03505 [Candidatus Lokiarchaeota archaeon]|nr:hypothetical protein [Candidatus Lokiarchaeota archaeon]